MSETRFEVKIFDSNNELADVQILTDKRYNSLSYDKSYSLVMGRCNETIPRDCHYRIKRLK